MHTSLVIGIGGGTGSGKTTVAERVLTGVGSDEIVVVNQDRYYRDLSHLEVCARRHHNFDHPSAIEEALLVEHVAELKAGRPASLPVYDFSAHLRRQEVEAVEPRPVILVEGILVLALSRLSALLDIKVFVDADADLRFIRRLRRDMTERGRTVEEVIEQYESTVRPMHMEFVEPSKRLADVIIPEGGFNSVAVGLLISRVYQRIRTVDSRLDTR